MSSPNSLTGIIRVKDRPAIAGTRGIFEMVGDVVNRIHAHIFVKAILLNLQEFPIELLLLTFLHIVGSHCSLASRSRREADLAAMKNHSGHPMHDPHTRLESCIPAA
jgi:hypothetical protein